MASDTTLASFGRWQQDCGMPTTNVFVILRYPVLFSVASAGTSGGPEGETELVLALLVAGTSSFLTVRRRAQDHRGARDGEGAGRRAQSAGALRGPSDFPRRASTQLRGEVRGCSELA